MPKAFVLMPFREPYNSYYQAIFKPALQEAGYEVMRADDLFTPRPIMLDIQNCILDADIVMCDMSDRNPNVFYELGMAHAIGKPAVLVARKEDDIPFDLRHIRTIVYETVSAGWESSLKKSILEAARSISQSPDVWPPPLIRSTGPDVQRQVRAIPYDDLITSLETFEQRLSRRPDAPIMLTLSMDSFLLQDDKIPKQFDNLARRLGLPLQPLDGLQHMTDLDDRLFVDYEIPFLNRSDALDLWFVVDGRRARWWTRIKDYAPREIRWGDRTRLDDLSLALYKRALRTEPTKLFKRYVDDLTAHWEENRLRFEKFIEFWNAIAFSSKYMSPQQFFVQSAEVAAEFAGIRQRILETVDLTHLGFGKPYSAADYIRELAVVLKRARTRTTQD